MPGALSSIRLRSLASIGPRPSIGLPKRIDHAPDHLFSDRNFGDPAGSFDRVALFDHMGFAEQGRADVVFFEIERNAVNIVGKLQQLAGRDFIETVNTRDPSPVDSTVPISWTSTVFS